MNSREVEKREREVTSFQCIGYYSEKSFDNVNQFEREQVVLFAKTFDIVKFNHSPSTLKIQGIAIGYDKYQNFTSISYLFLAFIKDASIESHV